MWASENIQDAKEILLSAAEAGNLERIAAGENSYIVAKGNNYKEDVYFSALESLLKNHELAVVRVEQDRIMYERNDSEYDDEEDEEPIGS
ncbi:MAG: hypothetical protein K2W95_19705 [Candidatus Obscuribacterales bacterium]|nr:hypothetical protein [Candidatus Obscuribacterales bacterium]